METTYKALDFSKHKTITRPDLNQLVANYQWINDNTPVGRFYKPSALVEVNTILISGKVQVKKTRRSKERKVRVKFGAGFDPTCRPAVTTGICSGDQKKIFCVVNGPKGTMYPTSEGCEISVLVDSTKIKRDFTVHWSALGYRTENLREF